MNFYLLDMKENSKESILKTIDYVSTMVIDKMMIPGQIENWVTIMDLNQASLGSIPVSTIKTIVGYLSNHYKSRLFRLYMINTTSSVTTIWKTIKFFLDEITVKKINILKEGTPEKLYLHCNKSQIPIKFGGS